MHVERGDDHWFRVVQGLDTDDAFGRGVVENVHDAVLGSDKFVHDRLVGQEIRFAVSCGRCRGRTLFRFSKRNQNVAIDVAQMFIDFFF